MAEPNSFADVARSSRCGGGLGLVDIGRASWDARTDSGAVDNHRRFDRKRHLGPARSLRRSFAACRDGCAFHDAR